jgi:uncharacterized protein YecE (DUF72 family)
MDTRFHIGISGWRYAPWRGVFYPPDLAQRRELEFASRQFRSIELNGSFYSLQRPQSYAQWYSQTPRGFVFAVKAPRYITHVRRLRKIDKPLANFLASGLFELREKLGPILWQFPPSLRYDEALFEDFLSKLPRDTESAAALARRREPRMRGRCSLAIDRRRPLRHAVEIRHESFRDPRFIRLLRRHRVAAVFADTAGKWPYFEDVTADFVYLRLHGDQELYASGYAPKALDQWAARIQRWSQGQEPQDAQRILDGNAPKRARRNVYCYFDNDMKVKAPRDARALMQRLGLAWNPPAPAGD